MKHKLDLFMFVFTKNVGLFRTFPLENKCACVRINDAGSKFSSGEESQTKVLSVFLSSSSSAGGGDSLFDLAFEPAQPIFSSFPAEEKEGGGECKEEFDKKYVPIY